MIIDLEKLRLLSLGIDQFPAEVEAREHLKEIIKFIESRRTVFDLYWYINRLYLE